VAEYPGGKALRIGIEHYLTARRMGEDGRTDRCAVRR